MKILLYDGLATVNDDGELAISGNYFRLIIPGDALRRAGHEVTVARRLSFDAATGRLAGVLVNGERITGADVVLIKWGITEAETLVRYARMARRNGQVIVHDFCDWTGSLSDHRNPLVRYGWVQVHKLCDAVFVNVPYLGERLEKLLERPTYVIPSALNLAAWDGIELEDVSDGPVLGWHGVPFFRSKDLALFKGWLGPFMEKHDLRLIHAGRVFPEFDNPGWNVSFATAAGIDPERVEARDAVSTEAFPASGRLNGVDIGLAPMANTTVSMCRSPNKVWDYVMRGIPYVGSPSDPYKALRTGHLAGTSLADQTPEAWQAELERLLDPAERVALAKANTAAIDWDIEDRIGDWESVLTELVDRRRAAAA